MSRQDLRNRHPFHTRRSDDWAYSTLAPNAKPVRFLRLKAWWARVRLALLG